MVDELECPVCGKRFKEKDSLEQHKKYKHVNSHKAEGLKQPLNLKVPKRYLKYAFVLLVLTFIVFGLYSLVNNMKTYPPTNLQGHVEVSPESHILKEPMQLAVQKHMLEHADGRGPPGIIINYNCEDYDCPPSLIPQLEAFTEKYPLNVYVTPYPNMDTKIALTKYGKLEILDEFDEDKIVEFIEG